MIPKQISEIEVPQATGKIETWKARVATAIVSREHRATWLPASALLILIGYFAFQQPAFLSPLNLTVMGAQAGPLLLISLGATFIVLMGSIDLSVAAVAALASAISAVLLQKFGTGYTTALLAVLGFGIAAGLLNSVLSTVLRLPSFIATLASSSIFTGIMLHVLDGTALFVNDDDFSMLANGQIIPRVPNVLLLSLLLWLVLSLTTSHTRFGRYIVAIGAGERVAKLSGIAINRYKTYAFVLSSTLAAIGGFFLLSRLGSAYPLNRGRVSSRHGRCNRRWRHGTYRRGRRRTAHPARGRAYHYPEQRPERFWRQHVHPGNRQGRCYCDCRAHDDRPRQPSRHREMTTQCPKQRR
ncbi:membrane hypothetical protein [Agrobacterium tumefaciens str. Kerr 14]|uniref:Uncharacterized protein n=1 Tax=Agrobacterium tumefaciens str. Kerr 14 TaxID=1183424 RepID=A0A1S7SGI5_AGRTU|nr:ABC transporter permease [Agrobacterium tumefaciens]CUX69080.1 membrane hypothetical protein [Agrobacterium tumefaciens str. Kerr 14]